MRQFLFALCLTALCFSSPANGEPHRIALIIANAEYDHWGDLPNPRVDSSNIERALSSLGYEVNILSNGSREDILRSLNQMSTMARELDSGSTAIVYFAGHGLQVDGINYLVPSDAPLDISGREQSLISMREVIDSGGIESDVFRMFVFDSCRKAPSDRQIGFVREDPPSGAMVLFSAELGTLAVDGAPGAGSPFGTAFSAYIRIPGIDTPRLMQHVVRYVQTVTGQQRPVYYSNSGSGPSLNSSHISDTSRRTALAYEAFEAELYQNALGLAVESAREGDVEAMLLAATLNSGLYNQPYRGVSINHVDALRWYHRAREVGDAYARLSFAQYVLSIAPSPERFDRTLAERIMEEAAAQQNPFAMYWMGLTSQLRAASDPSRSQQHLSQAMYWYERSSSAGFGLAAVNLGVSYEIGRGVPRSRANALEQYRRAAYLQVPRGMTNYANLLSTFGERRRDTRRDEEALSWHLAAAMNGAGDAEAMARLAFAYIYGIGVQTDRVAARRWYDLFLAQQRDPNWRSERAALWSSTIGAILAGQEVEEPLWRQPGE